MAHPDFDVDQSLEMETGDGQEISETNKISLLLKEAYFRHQRHVKVLHAKHNELQRNLNEVNSDFTKLQSDHAVTLRELRLVKEENKLLKAQINYLKTRLLGPCQSCGNAPAHLDQVKQLFGEASQYVSSGKTHMDDGQKSRRDIQEISADSGCPNDQTVRKIEITQQSASALHPPVKRTGHESTDQAGRERPETSPTNTTGPKLKLIRGQKRGKNRYTEEILPSKKTRLSPTAGSSAPSTSSRKPRDILQAPETQDIMNKTEPLVLAPETCALETQANTSTLAHINSPRRKRGSGRNCPTGKRLGSSSDEAPDRRGQFTAMVIPETVPFGADIFDTSEDDEEEQNTRVKFVKPPVCSSTPRDGTSRQGKSAENVSYNPGDQKKSNAASADMLSSSRADRTQSHTLADKTSESDTRESDIPSSPVFDRSRISKSSVVEDSMLSPSLFDEGDQKDICNTPTRKLNKRALDFTKATPPKVLPKSQNRVKILKDSSKLDTPKSDLSIQGAPSPSLLSGEPEFVKKPVKNPMDDFECLLDKEPAVTSSPTLTQEHTGTHVGKSSKGRTVGLKVKSQRKLSQTVNTSSGNSGSPRLKQTTLSQAMCFAAVRDTRNQRKKGSQKEKTGHTPHNIDATLGDGPLMTSTPFVTEQTTVREARNQRTKKDMKGHTDVSSSKADVTVADGPLMTSTPFVKDKSAEFRKPLVPSMAPSNETSQPSRQINKPQDKAKDIQSLPSLDADESLQHADLFTEAGVNGSIADDIKFSEYDRPEEESQTLGECTAKSAVFGAPKSSVVKPQAGHQVNKTMDDTDDAGGTSNKENAADDSFDIVPTKNGAPKFAHVAVVRKRNEREKLNAFACQECEAYFGEMDLPPEELKERMKSCRHRAEFAPVGTPPGFWDPNFPDTMECQAYMNTTQAKPSNFRRRRRYQKRFKSAKEDHEESHHKMSEDEDGLVLT